MWDCSITNRVLTLLFRHVSGENSKFAVNATVQSCLIGKSLWTQVKLGSNPTLTIQKLYNLKQITFSPLNNALLTINGDKNVHTARNQMRYVKQGDPGNTQQMLHKRQLLHYFLVISLKGNLSKKNPLWSPSKLYSVVQKADAK